MTEPAQSADDVRVSCECGKTTASNGLPLYGAHLPCCDSARDAESVCPAAPDGAHYFFSDDECAYCHKLDQSAEKVRACAVQLQSHMMLCRGPNNAGQTELSHEEYREVVRLVLDAAARYDGPGAKSEGGLADA